MGKDKKNQPSKGSPGATPPPNPVAPDVKQDDVSMLEMEAEDVLGEVPQPIPSTEDTTLRELFDRTNGVLVKLKDAETRAKEADRRANERTALAESERKEAERANVDAQVRRKEAERLTADYQARLGKLAEIALAEGVTFEPMPDTAIPPLAEVHKRAYDALRTFTAAQKKAESLTAAAATKEKDLDRRKGELDTGAKDLATKTADLDKREKGILEREAKVKQGEANAENDFLVQRRAITGSIDIQISQLREERDSLVKQIDDMRAADLAEWQERCAEREQKWRDQDLERAKRDTEQRNALTKELETEREKKLADLLDELEEIRLREQEKRDALWTARDEELADREVELNEKRKELRRLQNEVQAGTDILEEDRKAFDDKVAMFGAAKVAALEEELSAAKAHRDSAIKVRDQYFQDVEGRRELERQLGGRSPQDILASIDALKRERAELQNKLDTSLGDEGALRLERSERELSALREQRDVLQTNLADAQQRLTAQRTASVGTDGLKRANEAYEATIKMLEKSLKTQGDLLEAKIKEMRAEVDQYTQADDQRNPLKALVTYDDDPVCQYNPRTIPPIEGSIRSLKDFADDIRHRMATPQKDKPALYYSSRDIRCFLGGLAMSKLVLLQGISGTGKTSLPLAFAQAIGAADATVEVQAGWRDRQDLLGYYNAFHRQYYTTNFLQALYQAGTPGFKDRLFIIVLDEINLSRVEQFFADFLSALELSEERRKITLLADKVTDAPPALMLDGRHLPIPSNVWFVGTANHDETTTEFADKTYDRAHIMELPRNREQFVASSKPLRDPISFNAITEQMRSAQERRKGDVASVVDWLRKSDLATLLDMRFRVGWGNRLERDAERFVPIVVEAGGSVGEAVDHLLQTKVFRKLRDRHDVRAKSLEDVRDELVKSWPTTFADKPTRCQDLLEREIRSKQREEEG